ncbi:helix-turn-helix domain-containing protein [Petrotoga mexicana]
MHPILKSYLPLVKGAVELLAKKLNCSRYSIYNYLNEIGAEASKT